MIHTDSPGRSLDMVSPEGNWQTRNAAEAKRLMLIEIANFQSQSNKLFGYLDNDDLISVDIDASGAGA